MIKIEGSGACVKTIYNLSAFLSSFHSLKIHYSLLAATSKPYTGVELKQQSFVKAC